MTAFNDVFYSLLCSKIHNLPCHELHNLYHLILAAPLLTAAQDGPLLLPLHYATVPNDLASAYPSTCAVGLYMQNYADFTTKI